MKHALLKILKLYLAFVGLFVAGKILFMGYYHDLYSGLSVWDMLSAIAHGMRLDLSVAGYLTVIPALLVSAAFVIDRPRVMRTVTRCYLVIAAAVVAMVIAADTVLYGYWGFKLDMTPVFYLISSPKAAAASAPLWVTLLGVVSVAAVAAGIYWLLDRVATRQYDIPPEGMSARGRWLSAGVTLLAGALLFIPIRGSFSVAPVNLSSAYFSDDQRLNHAAVNPAFSLLYSATHQNNFSRQFRFMEAPEAARLMAEMTDTTAFAGADSLLATPRPDVYLIILESFSNHLLPVTGGENVAPGLDSIARSGLLFDNFYACSFRTDRALPAILAGYPSQPTTSLMKYVEKTENLPSVPRSMKQAGYATDYYYGGDANFTNMKAFLVSAGFDRVVSDKDFSGSELSGKWGAHDGAVFARCLGELTPYDSLAPRLRVIQTSSSHEPFEVPFKGRFDDPAANAFEYADSCLTAFVDSLAATPSWDNSLVVIVADHYGCYPRDPAPFDVDARHRVPLVMTGGALARRGRVATAGSQNDIAATLLDMLGIGRGEFVFSHDILDPGAPHFAYVSSPSYVAMVNDGGATVYDIERGITVTDSARLELPMKAFVQTLYDDLDRR